jgi:hypothetical protein
MQANLAKKKQPYRLLREDMEVAASSHPSCSKRLKDLLHLIRCSSVLIYVCRDGGEAKSKSSIPTEAFSRPAQDRQIYPL